MSVMSRPMITPRLTGRKVARPDMSMLVACFGLIVARQAYLSAPERVARRVAREASKQASKRITRYTPSHALADGSHTLAADPHAHEGHTRYDARGNRVGMYRDAGVITAGRAAGCQKDPFGRHARRADAITRSKILDLQVSKIVGTEPTDGRDTLPSITADIKAWADLIGE